MAGDIRFIVEVDSKKGTVAIKQLDKNIRDMGGTAQKASPKFAGMWKQIVAGVGITGGVTMAIRGMMNQFKDVIAKGREFEKEWANVTTMLSTSRAATDNLRSQLRMLSPTLGSTTDLARGMYQVLSASIEPAKAIRFLGVAAKSAKAGVTDTKIAVDALSTVINAYGLEAESATEISDIMFQTVKRGKLTYEEMSMALGTVVPIASAIGIEFKEVAAAMSTLTRQGIDVGTATMQLRQVLMAVLGPTSEAEKLAKSLGLEWSVSALKAKGLGKFLAELKEKAKGDTEALGILVPNVRALTAVMALAGEGAAGFAEDLVLVDDALGTTDEAFRKQTESVDFWMETFKFSMGRIKEAIYEGLTSELREAIRTTEDFDKKVTAATNRVANDVSLHMSGIAKEVGWLAKAWKATDKFLFGWSDNLRKTLDSTDALAESEAKLAESLFSMENALARSKYQAMLAAGEFGWLNDETKKLTEETKKATQIFEVLSGSEIKWELLGPPSGLIAEVEELADALGYIQTQLGGIAFVAGSTGEAFKENAEYMEVTGADMAAAVGTTFSSLAGQNKALAVAGAIISTYAGAAKSLQMYGMPFAIPFIAMAIAAGMKQVKGIQAQTIPSGLEGGLTTKEGIYHLHPGELVTPASRVSNVYNQTTGGARAVFNINVTTTRAVNAEQLFKDMQREARRYGYNL